MLKSRTMSSLTSSSTKQDLKADDHNCSFMASSQPQDDHSRTGLSLLGSPRLFRNLLTKTAEKVMSPTSLLDTKHIFGLKYPSLLKNKALLKHKSINSSEPCNASSHTWESFGSSAIGLAIITSDDEDPVEDPTKVTTRASVFGNQLKIQVPPGSPTTPPSITEFPRSPSDFGIKTRNLALLSPSSSFRKRDTPGVLTRQLSVTEMELSEDYTCVISHGPNPKTIHIFDNCVVGSYSGVLCSLEFGRNDCCFLPHSDNADGTSGCSSLCNSCKSNTGPKKGCSGTEAYGSQVHNRGLFLHEVVDPEIDAVNQN